MVAQSEAAAREQATTIAADMLGHWVPGGDAAQAQVAAQEEAAAESEAAAREVAANVAEKLLGAWLPNGGAGIIEEGWAHKAAAQAQANVKAKQAAAQNAQAAQAPQGAAANAQRAQSGKGKTPFIGSDWKPGAPVAPEPPKEKKGKKKAGGGRARSGGGGGRAGSGAGAPSRDNGPVTVVSLDSGNQIRTQYFAAASGAKRPYGAGTPLAGVAAGSARNTGAAKNANAAASSTGPAANAVSARGGMAAAKTAGVGLKDAALPRSPEMIAQRQPKAKAPQQKPEALTIDLTQNFDLITEDASAARKILETLKPDFEALIRQALAKISSNKSRTAYAQ